MLSNLLWKLPAFILSRKPVADWLIAKASMTPYFHLDGYMDRWWLFNAYGSDPAMKDGDRHNSVRFKWLPSIRIHHILREDFARDMHDHPWNARTIILKGDYDEERMFQHRLYPTVFRIIKLKRKRGDTATLKFGEYHNITRVSPFGVWTMFFTWKYRGKWGFLVDGKKVPHNEYTNGGAA